MEVWRRQLHFRDLQGKRTLCSRSEVMAGLESCVDREEETSAFRIAVGCLGRPSSLFAIATLVLNDHVLKPLIGSEVGWLTGKLSDFAGLYVFPFLLASLLSLVVRRPALVSRLALFVTGLWWASAKTTVLGHDLTVSLLRPMFGALMIARDPTDVMALVMLWPSWRLWRAQAQCAPQSRRLRMLPVVLSGLACMATSANSAPRFWGLVVHDHELHAIVDELSERSAPGPTAEMSYLITQNGPVRDEKLVEEAKHYSLSPHKTVRLGTKLFRMRSPMGVEVSNDEGRTWRTEWELDADRVAVVRRAHAFRHFDDVGPYDIAVAPDGSGKMYLAVGSDGLIMRSPDGTWTRDWVPWAPPPPERQVDIRLLPVEMHALLVFLLGFLLVLRWRLHGRTWEPAPYLIVVVLLAAWGIAFTVLGFWPTREKSADVLLCVLASALLILHGSRRPVLVLLGGVLLPMVTAFLLAAIELLIFVPACVGVLLAAWGWLGRARGLLVLARPLLLVPIVGLLPYLLWTDGIIATYGMATAVAVISVLVVCAESWRAAGTSVRAMSLKNAAGLR